MDRTTRCPPTQCPGPIPSRSQLGRLESFQLPRPLPSRPGLCVPSSAAASRAYTTAQGPPATVPHASGRGQGSQGPGQRDLMAILRAKQTQMLVMLVVLVPSQNHAPLGFLGTSLPAGFRCGVLQRGLSAGLGAEAARFMLGAAMPRSQVFARSKFDPSRPLTPGAHPGGLAS